MSDSAADQGPKPQPKWIGGPPRPPKKTARGLEDGMFGDNFTKVMSALTAIDRLIELLEASRESPLDSLNELETDLDERIVECGNLLPRGWTLLREYAMECLKPVRDYRRRHPRLDTGDPELREQARKILDKIT